jgi:hypothetical protein
LLLHIEQYVPHTIIPNLRNAIPRREGCSPRNSSRLGLTTSVQG